MVRYSDSLDVWHPTNIWAINTYNKQTAKFEIKIDGLSEKLIQEVIKIVLFKYINTIERCKEFEEILSSNKWNKTATTQILKNLKNDEVVDKEQLNNSWNTIKTYLLGLVYPKQEERLFYKKLNRIYQTNYRSIEDYYDEIIIN